MKQDSKKEILKQKIRDVLDKNIEKDLSTKGLDELVAEVSIYHQELEYQNEELLRVQRELEESKTYFVSLYDEAPIGYVICNSDLLVESFNKAFGKMFGKSNKDILEHKFTEFIDSESQDSFYLAYKRLLKQETQETVEVDLVKREQKIPARIECNLLIKEERKLIRIAIVDLTVEKRTEQDLIESQEKFRSYIEYSPIPIFLVNENGNYLFTNKAAADLLGYTTGEITLLSIPDIISDRVMDKTLASWQDLKKKGRTENFETILRTKKGEDVEILLDAVKLSDNEYIAFCKDLTERKESEVKYKNIISTSIDGFWINDEKGNIIDVNASYCKMVGYSEDELLNMSISDVEVIDSDEEIQNRLNEIHDKGFATFESQHKHKNGNILDIEVSVTYYKNNFVAFIRDITEKKQISQKIRYNEERLSRITNNLNDVIFTTDLQLNTTYITPSIERLVGDSVEEHLSKSIDEMFPPESLKKIKRILKEELGKENDPSVEKNRYRIIELQYYTADGGRVWVSSNVSFIRDETGKIIGIQGVSRNIDQQKKAEEQLKESEERYRLITENMQDLVAIHEPDGKYKFLSPSIKHLLGYSEDEIIGKSPYSLLHPEDVIRVQDKSHNIVLSERAVSTIEYRIKQKSGKYIWFQTITKPILSKHNKVLELHTVSRDITENKLYEFRLKEQNLRFKLASDSAGIGVWDFDVRNNILVWDDWMFKLHGVKREEFSGAYDAWQKLIHPDDKDRAFKEVELALQKKKEFNTSFRIIRGDGEIRYLRAYAKINLDDDNNPSRMIGVNYDITEIKIAELKLMESEFKYRSLFENMTEGFSLHKVILDENGNTIDHEYVDANPAYEKLFGYKREEIIGKRVTELFPGIEEDSADWFSNLGEVAMTGKSLEMEDYSEALNKWFYISAYSPQKGYFALITEDVTKNKLAEQKLKQSEERFRKIFQENLAVMILLDPETHKIVDVNNAAIEFYGYTKEAFLEKQIEDLSMIDDAKVSSNIAKALNQERKRFESVHKLIDGTECNVEIFTSLIELEGKSFLHTIIHDITDRKTYENELKSRREFIETVLEHLPIGLALNKIDEGTAEYMNRKFQEIYGWPSEELKNISQFFEKVYPDKEYREKMVKRTMEDIQSGDVSRMSWQNITITTKNNEKRIINAQNIPLYGQNTMVSTVIDVTGQKRAEAALIESQRLGAIGEMSSAVAHDFNNSLQSIFGNLELALLNVQEEHPARPYLNTIRIAAGDAATRVKLLQRFAGKSKSKQNYEVVDLNEIVKDVIIQARPLWKDNAERTGLEIKIETVLENNIFIKGNDGELRSVVYNIVKNSIEAMTSGGTIKFASGRNGKENYLRIYDTGKGMDEKTRARVFQPFFTTKGFESGRGLGLSGAYTIVQEHGGKIQVLDSSPGGGTTFELLLPAASKIIKENKIQNNEESPRSIKVIWIDDDNMITDLAKDVLVSLNCEGDVVSSGKEALEKLEETDYNIVITDIGMPGMSGWELAEKINQRYNRKIPIVVTTGWGDEVSEEKRTMYNIKHVLSKPFKIEQIKKLLKEFAV